MQRCDDCQLSLQCAGANLGLLVARVSDALMDRKLEQEILLPKDLRRRIGKYGGHAHKFRQD